MMTPAPHPDSHPATASGRAQWFGTGPIVRVGVLLASLGLLSCEGAANAPPPNPSRATAPDDEGIDPDAFREGFEVIGDLILEETDAAMVVVPMVYPVGEGQLLLAEPLEGQVHLYSSEGSLRRNVGAKGSGPGAMGADLLPDGEIAVTDVGARRLTFFPAEEGADPQMTSSPLEVATGIWALGRARYLLAGVASLSEERSRLLHIWNRESGELESSFMPIGVPDRALSRARAVRASSAAVRGDTIWGSWALSDTLYRFDSGGDLRERIPIPMPRPLGDLGDQANNPPNVFRPYLLDDGHIAVSIMVGNLAGSQWDLVIMDRSGNAAWAARNQPQLMAIVGDLFLFDDPASALPNRWLVARWRGP